jgi:glycosyltransferase involved in cell wall biosynthesis
LDKFTLIIPTRERADTLLYTLKAVTNSDYDNFKVIISDNNSADNTRDVAYSINDKRFQYVNPGERLSMSANYEYALSHVKEGWVSYLGDDDGLLPNAVSNLVALANDAQVDAVSSSYARFLWGDEAMAMPGQLFVPAVLENKIHKSQRQLENMLNGGADYASSYSELPWIYHGGAVKIDLINKARGLGGKFFYSPIPDVYSSVAISRVAGKFLKIGEPLFVSGNSKHSIGVSQIKFMPSKLDSAPFNKFVEEFEFPFDQRYVLGKSLMFIVYEAFYKSEFLGGNVAAPNLNKQVEISLKFAGRNLPYVYKEAIETLLRNNSISMNSLLSGTFEWLKYNLITKKQLNGTNYKLNFNANIFDATKYMMRHKYAD